MQVFREIDDETQSLNVPGGKKGLITKKFKE